MPTDSRTGRSPARRGLLAACGVLLVGLLVAAAVIGFREIGTEEPATRPVASPRTVTGDPRTADPCPFLDLAALQRFGAVVRSPGTGPSGCRADVTASDGRPAQVTASFSRGVAVDGGSLPVGDLVQRRGRTTDGFGPGARQCQHSVDLPDGNQVLLRAYSFTDVVPPCDVADRALDTTTAVLQRDGVTYDPGRNRDDSLAGADACRSVDPAVLARSGIGTAAFPGYAGWSCSWGTDRSYASVSFGGTTGRTGVAGTPAPPVAGRPAFVLRGQGDCSLTVEHRTGPDDRLETVTTAVRLPDGVPDAACAVATDLATTAETGLPAG